MEGAYQTILNNLRSWQYRQRANTQSFGELSLSPNIPPAIRRLDFELQSNFIYRPYSQMAVHKLLFYFYEN